jgi:predicted CXXCH cytochrome family protein
MLPILILLIIILTVGIIITSIFMLKHEEAPEGEFKTIVGATYVGSSECKKCHERRYLEWGTTLHSRMLQDARANPLVIIGDFDSPSDIRTFNKEDVAYTIGSQWKQQYLKKIEDDYFVLPAQYDIQSGTWVKNDGENWQKKSWYKECAGCHATGVDPDKKTFIEPGIGCEACHGPGSNHIKAVPGFEIATTVNPVRLTTFAEAQICGSCHARGRDKSGQYSYPVGYMSSRGISNLRLYFDAFSQKDNPDMFWPSGDSRYGYMQYLDWQKSEHAKTGVSCRDCHTIHLGKTTYQTKFVGDSLCKSCHSSTAYRGVHRIHTFGSCIECHMPKTVISELQSHTHSHTFKFISPKLSIEMGGLEKQPNSCSGCHKHEKTPLRDLLEMLDAAKKTDMPKPFLAHRREPLKK